MENKIINDFFILKKNFNSMSDINFIKNKYDNTWNTEKITSFFKSTEILMNINEKVVLSNDIKCIVFLIEDLDETLTFKIKDFNILWIKKLKNIENLEKFCLKYSTIIFYGNFPIYRKIYNIKLKEQVLYQNIRNLMNIYNKFITLVVNLFKPIIKVNNHILFGKIYNEFFVKCKIINLK